MAQPYTILTACCKYMGWLWRGWNGEEDLWGLVWIYGVLLIVVCHAACIGLRIFTDIDIDSPAGAGGFFRYLELFYCIWMLVALWRCAFNTSWSGWAYLARLIVILYTVAFCFLSYKQQRALLPVEMLALLDTRLLTQVIKQLHLTPVVLYVMQWVHGK